VTPPRVRARFEGRALSRRLTGASALALALLLLPRQIAYADPLAASPGDALDLTADKLEVDVPAGTAILTGHVTLVRGGLRVDCPRIDVKYDEAPRVTWAKGSGGVSADIRGVHAEAPEVELDLARHVLELRGGVRLTRGQGWLNADKATIEIASAKVTLKDVKGSLPVALPKP
jgi:lipopolysaccharide export system protein LptA